MRYGSYCFCKRAFGPGAYTVPNMFLHYTTGLLLDLGGLPAARPTTQPTLHLALLAVIRVLAAGLSLR